MLARLTSGIALASIAALVLVGCTPEGPTPSATTAPASTEATPANDEHVEAARTGWELYQSRLSEIGEDPASATIDPLLEIATPEHADFLLENFGAAADRRIHTEGSRATTAFDLRESSNDSGELQVALCEDVSDERLVGDEGQDLTRPDQTALRSRFVDFVRTDDGRYIIAAVVEYQGPTENDPCR